VDFTAADADARIDAGRMNMNAECRRQKAEGRRQRIPCAHCLAATRQRSIRNGRGYFAKSVAGIVVLVFALQPTRLFADGGTLRLSQRQGDLQISVFTSPAAPRVGMVDVSVLVQDAATGRARSDVPIVVRLQSVAHPELVLQQTATTEDATNKLFHAALMDVPLPGTWLASVLLSDEIGGSERNTVDAPLTFNLAIAPPLPAWLQIAPWVAWPFAVLALFAVHQRLVFLRPSYRTSGDRIFA
jgi:hypothetical protein